MSRNLTFDVKSESMTLVIAALSIFLSLLSMVLADLIITKEPTPLTSSGGTLICGAAAEVLPDVSWFKDGVYMKGIYL